MPESSDPDARSPLAAASQVVLLALWLGAAGFLAAVVAPAAFEVLPSRELAGALVGRTLPVLFVVGAAIGVATLAIELVAAPRSYRLGRIGAACITTLSCAIAQLAVAPRIAALRAGLSVPLASLPADDPQRVDFARLHMMSVAWLGVAILAGVTAIVLAVLTLRPRYPR